MLLCCNLDLWPVDLEMGSVTQNPIQTTVKTAHLTSVHSTAQNGSDNLPSSNVVYRRRMGYEHVVVIIIIIIIFV